MIVEPKNKKKITSKNVLPPNHLKGSGSQKRVPTDYAFPGEQKKFNLQKAAKKRIGKAL